MGTEDRKRRKLQEREGLILDAAHTMLLERGYIGLTMDRIAEAVEYSKGTVYQHFSSKEDLLSALLLRTAEIRVLFFERALAFEGTTRERFGAIGVAAEIFLGLYPEHFRIEQTIRIESVREKAAGVRQEEIANCDCRCLETGFQVLRAAAEVGDLELREGDTPENLTFGLWCLYTGAFSFHTQNFPLSEFGIGEFSPVLWRNAHLMLDGMGWTPHSSEYDHIASRMRVLVEVFPEEAQQLGLLDSSAQPNG
jgi:AcrR family transcriptional regulator